MCRGAPCSGDAREANWLCASDCGLSFLLFLLLLLLVFFVIFEATSTVFLGRTASTGWSGPRAEPTKDGLDFPGLLFLCCKSFPSSTPASNSLDCKRGPLFLPRLHW